MNKVIKFLILSDLALLTGLGFITPIFAIFLTETIQGGNVEVVGFAAAIYWIVHSLVMIPIGKHLDKYRGEHDDLWFIILGNFLAALAIFGYFFARLPWHIYVLQGLYGLGLGMNVPAYTAIFTRHVDKEKIAYEWGSRGTYIGIGTGIAGAIGGIIVQNFGFDILFSMVIVFVIIGAILPVLISGQMRRR